jgi:hypothetical protein
VSDAAKYVSDEMVEAACGGWRDWSAAEYGADRTAANPQQMRAALEAAAARRQQTTLGQYPFPLRPGLDVWLRLPRDLTGEEAERLCRFVRGLAREDPP